MAWVAVDKYGSEFIFKNGPQRIECSWSDCRSDYDESYFCVEDYNSGIKLPKGTIRKIIGYELTWYNDPVEIR